MEAFVLLVALAFIFLFFSGALKAIGWAFGIFFKVGCFFASIFIFGLLFLFLMAGCLVSLVK